jgi:hypothetical protein
VRALKDSSICSSSPQAADCKEGFFDDSLFPSMFSKLGHQRRVPGTRSSASSNFLYTTWYNFNVLVIICLQLLALLLMQLMTVEY